VGRYVFRRLGRFAWGLGRYRLVEEGGLRRGILVGSLAGDNPAEGNLGDEPVVKGEVVASEVVGTTFCLTFDAKEGGRVFIAYPGSEDFTPLIRRASGNI